MKNSNSKISFFISSFRGGGAERVFLNLTNGFVKRGFDVDLILAQKEGPYLKNVSEKVNIIDLKSKRILFSVPSFIKYLRKEKPNYLFSTLTHVNIIACLTKIIFRPKTKVVIRQANYLSSSRNKVIKLLVKIFYNRADKIIAISKGVKKDLISKFKVEPKKIKVIYNPIFKEDIFKKAKETVNHKWFINKKYPIILGVGRLTAQKDFFTLIHAFNKLQKKKEIKLVILGEGEDRSKLQELVRKLKLRDKVDLYGFVDNPYTYMARSDVFVLSSQHEGFGNVLVEAMACGTPVVSTNCLSGPSEILKNGEYGKLVPVGDIKALARAISETLENPIAPETLRKRAEFFSVERAVGKYLEIIK
jgi:glycosyltransferase involved in cell wall biosynthesis